MFAALYLPSLPGRAADARAQLMTVAREFSPRVERLHDDLLALDVSGLGCWFENSRALGEALRQTAADRGLAAHVAIAATRTAAVLCARGRAGLTVALPGEETAHLSSLPLSVLSAWTAGSRQPASPEATAGLAEARQSVGRPAAGSLHTAHCPLPTAPIAVFQRWGLKTLGDLANLPGVEVSERLGQAGIVWQRLARGEDLQPLVPAPPDEHYEESLDLEWPIDRLEPLSFVLGRLLETLCLRLEHADRGVAILHVRLELVGGQRFARALQLPAPMRDARTLRTLALLDLESNSPPAAIDRVTVAADVVEGRVLQFSLLQRALPAERLSTLLARLSALMGSDRVGAPTLVETYRPGAFAMVQFTAVGSGQWAVGSSSFNTEGTAPAAAAERLAREAAARGGGAPRALKEDAKVAEILKINVFATSASSALKNLATDHRPLATAVIRRFRQPIPAHVDVQQGRPVRVTSNRRHLRGGNVEVCAGPWRSSGDWWVTEKGSGLPTLFPWDRDEWEVTLRDGATYVVFQDRHRGCWFIDGILD